LLLAHVEDHPLAQDAGAADEDVQVAELLERQPHDGLAPRHRGHALGTGDRLTAGLLDHADDFVRRRARRIAAVHADTVVVDDDLRARGRQADGHRPSDPRPAARHDRHLAVEHPHTWLLYLAWGPRHGPHTPTCSDRPGKPVAVLYLRAPLSSVGASTWPPHPHMFGPPRETRGRPLSPCSSF